MKRFTLALMAASLLGGCASSKFPHLNETAARAHKTWINPAGPNPPAGAPVAPQPVPGDPAASPDKAAASSALDAPSVDRPREVEGNPIENDGRPQ